MMSKNREEHGLQLLPILVEPVVGHDSHGAERVFSLGHGALQRGQYAQACAQKIMLNDGERG